MDRVYKAGAQGVAPTAAENASGPYPTAGVPGVTAPTKAGPFWFHMVMEELAAVITAAGIALDKTVLTQLRDAIKILRSNNDTTWQLSGVISPAQIVANTNDYNPANLAASTVLRVNTSQ